MKSHVSFTIHDLPGCQGARMQAVDTADRKICAFTSAWASLGRGNGLHGAIVGDPQDITTSFCDEHSVNPAHLALWAASINGQKFDAHLAPINVLDLILDDYQLHCIQGLEAAGGVLGLFMGAGKTAIAVSAAIGYGGLGNNKRCWIACPLNAMPTWQRAVPELASVFKEVKIFSIDSAHKYTSVPEGDVLIVDEAHRAGHHTTRRTKALHTIRSRFAFGLCLTGTLVHQGVETVLSVKDLAVPGLASFARTWSAGETFSCLVEKKIGARTVTGLEKPTTKKPQFLEWLSHGVQLLTPNSHEVQNAFQLPGQDCQEVLLNDPWPALEAEVARIAHELFEIDGVFPHAQAVAHVLARDRLDQKLDWLAGELSGLSLDVPQQIVVFANYRDSLDGAQQLLESQGISFVRIDGDVIGRDRSECERKFQAGEAQVFLGQIHAASESMNLQNASISIALDVSWSAIDYAQALARTHRRGQNTPCLHVDLVANRFQARVLDRLRSGADFAADCAEYQDIKRALNNLVTEPEGAPHAH